jgi:putative oligomerization/nucleic acid binding protein
MGLVRGMARTAVVAGTATAVSNRVSRRQARRWNEQEYAEQAQYAQPQYAQPQYAQPQPQPQQWSAPAPAPAAADTDDLADQLQQLAQLKQQGVLSEAEFAAAKAKLLNL